jgi:hypothetical protein
MEYEASITGIRRAQNWSYPEGDEFTPHANILSDFIHIIQLIFLTLISVIGNVLLTLFY